MVNTYEAAVDFANKLDYADKNYDVEQVIRWLNGAKLNAGKFIFVKEDNYLNIEKHDNWDITYYIVQDGDKLRRCGKKFADDMIAAGKGVYYGTTNEFKAWRGW